VDGNQRSHCGTPGLDEARPLVRKAIQARTSEDHDAAKRLLDAAIAADPKFAPAHFHLAQLASAKGDHARAVRHYEKTCALDPRRVENWAAWASGLVELRDAKKIRSFKARLDRAPLAPPQRLHVLKMLKPQPKVGGFGAATKAEANQMIRHLVDQDATKALALGRRLLRKSPDAALLLNAMGSAHALAGEFEQADVLFRRAVERAPDDPSVHMNYARFLLGQERFSQALVHLRRSAELRPGVAQTDLMTAAALVGDEQFESGP